MTGNLAIEGEPSKPYQLFQTDQNGGLVKKLAEAETREELWRLHKRRGDYHYAILHKRKRIWP